MYPNSHYFTSPTRDFNRKFDSRLGPYKIHTDILDFTL
jgi:hypothetical protein